MSGKSGQSREKCTTKSQASSGDGAGKSTTVKTGESCDSGSCKETDEAFLKKIFEKTGDNPNDWTNCKAIRIETNDCIGKDKDKAEKKSKEKQPKQQEKKEKEQGDAKKGSSGLSTVTSKGSSSSSTVSTSKSMESKAKTTNSKESTTSVSGQANCSAVLILCFTFAFYQNGSYTASKGKGHKKSGQTERPAK